jgi:hypothetical protein
VYNNDAYSPSTTTTIIAFQRPISTIESSNNLFPICSSAQADHFTSSNHYNGTFDIRLGRRWQQFKRATTRCGLGMVRLTSLCVLHWPSILSCDRLHIQPGAQLELPAHVLTISTSRARRPNGATQTFRRTSNAVNTSATAPQNTENLPIPAVSSQPPRYVPPHRNGTVNDPRYSKNQLLDLYRLQQTDDGLQEDLQNLYIGGWQPNGQNGAPAAGWGRNDASREQPPGPDVCWDDDGNYEPLALTEMDDEEREVGCALYKLVNELGTNILNSSSPLRSTLHLSRRPLPRKTHKRTVSWVANCLSTHPADLACNLPVLLADPVARPAIRTLSRMQSPLQMDERSSERHRRQLRFFAGGRI